MASPPLCTPGEVRLRISSTIGDEALSDLIDNVIDEIEDYVGAWLTPRPTDPAATMTLLFDVERAGTSLRMMIGDRHIGIRTLTALGVAATSQPETGGVYTTVPLASVLLRPRPTDDGPASRLVIIDTSSAVFSRGFNTVSVTGSFGPALVAPRAREIAIELVMLDLTSTPGQTSERLGDWSATYAGSSRANILSGLASLNPFVAV